MTSFERSFIPYGTHWSTPFAKWQGSLQSLHPMRFGAACARAHLERRGVDPGVLDSMVLGWTVPSLQGFPLKLQAVLLGGPCGVCFTNTLSYAIY